MEFLKRMTEVIDYIEEHITENFDVNAVSKIVCCNVYQFGRIFSIEAIGAEDAGGDYSELTHFEVPASTWAVFTAKGTLNQKIHPIDAVTTRIFSEWLPSSSYEKSMDYEIQVYGPGNTQSYDYTCEIWIPVKKKA